MIRLSATAFETVDDVLGWLLRGLLNDGEIVSPRGNETRELLGVSFTLTNPRARLVTNVARRFSLPLALGEFAWHMRAADDVGTLSYYAKRWADFSDDTQRISGSCYGSRIFGSRGKAASQWDSIVSLLRTDPATRRAVISLWSDDTQLATSRDVPCTSTIQFLQRTGRLHAVVTMRSNDTIWGVPYDVFLFTMLQEHMAGVLGVEVGEYTHFAGSMHLYRRHYDFAERILGSSGTPIEMPPMPEPKALEAFLAAETTIRSGDPCETTHHLADYWRELADVLAWFRLSRDSSVRASDVPKNRYSDGIRLLAKAAVATAKAS